MAVRAVVSPRGEDDGPPPWWAGLDSGQGRRLYGQDASAYATGRPNYPPRIFELLVDPCGLRAGSRVVEIGPGTGLVTRHLVEAQAEVTGIEPDQSMADYLRSTIDGDRLELVLSTFEDARLPEDSFDLAVAATSFHWVSRAAGMKKLARVIRPGGWAAVFWMLFDDPTQPDDRFRHAVHDLLGEWPDGRHGAGPPWTHLRRYSAELQAAGFEAVRAEEVRFTISLDARGIRALYATRASILRRPPAEGSHLLDALEKIVSEDYGGQLERVFLTTIFMARR